MNKKQKYEKYIENLIKESKHRILNEKELMHLIRYTEAGFIPSGLRGRLRAALGYSQPGMIPAYAPTLRDPTKQDPNVLLGVAKDAIGDALGPRVTGALRRAGSGFDSFASKYIDPLVARSKKGLSNFAGDVVDMDDEIRRQAAISGRLALDAGKGKASQLAQQGKEWAKRTASDAGNWAREKAGQLAKRGGEWANEFFQNKVSPALQKVGQGVYYALNNPGEVYRTAKDATGRAVNTVATGTGDLATGRGISQSAGMGVPNSVRQIDFDSNSNSPFGMDARNNIYGLGGLSEGTLNNILENTIIRNGRPIKQKPILSEAEELELVKHLYSEGFWDWIQNKWDDFQARNTLRNMNPEFYRQLQNSFDPGISPVVRRIVNPAFDRLSQKYPELVNQYAQLANGNNIDSYITALSQHMGISPDEVVARLQASGQSGRGTRGGRGNRGTRGGRSAQTQGTPTTQIRRRPRWDRFRNPRRVLTGQEASPVAAAPQSQVSIPATQKRGKYANIDYSAMFSESALLRSFWINENSNLCKESLSTISPRNMYQLYLIKESLSPELLARITKDKSNIAERIKDMQAKADADLEASSKANKEKIIDTIHSGSSKFSKAAGIPTRSRDEIKKSLEKY